MDLLVGAPRGVAQRIPAAGILLLQQARVPLQQCAHLIQIPRRCRIRKPAGLYPFGSRGGCCSGARRRHHPAGSQQGEEEQAWQD